MKFRYTGKEYSEFMGFEWVNGTVHDVTDERSIRKLDNSILFERADGSGEPKKRVELPQEPVRPLPPALENLLEEAVEPPHMPAERHEPSIRPIQPPRRGRRPNQDR